MGHRLPVGLTLHERLDVVPRSRPVQAQGDLPSGRARTGPDGLDDLLESLGVVGGDLVDPAAEVGEPVFVGRQYLVGAEIADLRQLFEVVAQRIRELLGVHRDVGGDPGEDVVARQQQPLIGAVEAHVSR